MLLLMYISLVRSTRFRNFAVTLSCGCKSTACIIHNNNRRHAWNFIVTKPFETLMLHFRVKLSCKNGLHKKNSTTIFLELLRLKKIKFFKIKLRNEKLQFEQCIFFHKYQNQKKVLSLNIASYSEYNIYYPETHSRRLHLPSIMWEKLHFFFSEWKKRTI